ncbi:Calx-beta domain-containing protein, partial [Mesorhizobium sp. NFR06]|uniref:immunoglobulin-like domain-containing protein n=1 Tax=Mesorhizobium sp. NFR06 TaxID=1566290 RepID=UPI0008E9A70F
MSVGDIKVFTISQNGFVLSVQAVDVGGGQTEFVIKSIQGQGDLNAIWWSDGDSTVDGSVTLSKSDSSLNMNGTGIVWDGYDYLSSAGLGKLGEAKSTFITQGETLTYIANVSLAEVSTLGIRATSVNGGDSIKGVDTSADHTYTAPTVAIGDTSVTEGGNAQFTISLSNAYAYDIKVFYGTGDGTATAGSDYTGTSGYVIIPAGQTTATVYVQTLDDYYEEANETFNVTLSSATTTVLGSNINLGVADGTGVGTITDDKDATTITLSAPAAVDEGGSITVTANVDHAPQGDLTITLSNGQTITILSGQTSGQVTFAALGEDVYKDASTLNLGINSTTGGNYEALVTTATASVAVHDTIDTTAITLDDVSVNEGAGTATITAHVANAVTGTPLVINLDNGASVTIAVGATSGVSTAFAVQGDDPYVDSQSYQVGVSGTSGGNFEALDTTDKATVTVHDTIDTTA